MTTIPIIVEGVVDKAIIEAHVKRTQPALSLQISSVNGKTELMKGLESAIAAFPGRLCVAEDLDLLTVAKLREKYCHSLSAKYQNVSNAENVFEVDDNRVFLIPMGLENDPELSQFNLKQHLVEDHVVAILLRDNEVVRSLSQGRVNSSELLKSTLITMAGTQACQGFPIESCKELLDLAMSIMRFCTHPGTFTSRVIENADPAIIEVCMPQIVGTITSLIYTVKC